MLPSIPLSRIGRARVHACPIAPHLKSVILSERSESKDLRLSVLLVILAHPPRVVILAEAQNLRICRCLFFGRSRGLQAPEYSLSDKWLYRLRKSCCFERAGLLL